MHRIDRRITLWEFEGAQSLRDGARKDVEVLFPRAQILFAIVTSDGKAVVNAQIIGDATPHPREDIVDWLGELGVSVLNPSERSVNL